MGTFFCSTWTTPTSSAGGVACAGLLERAKPTITASAAIASTIKGTISFRFLKSWTKRVFVILFSDSPRAGELSAVPTLGSSPPAVYTGRACLCVSQCPAEEATALPLRFACRFVDFGEQMRDHSWSRDEISPQRIVTSRV